MPLISCYQLYLVLIQNVREFLRSGPVTVLESARKQLLTIALKWPRVAP